MLIDDKRRLVKHVIDSIIEGTITKIPTSLSKICINWIIIYISCPNSPSLEPLYSDIYAKYITYKFRGEIEGRLTSNFDEDEFIENLSETMDQDELKKGNFHAVQ